MRNSNQSKESRGFGFIDFEEKISSKKCLESEHILEGRKFNCKEAFPEECKTTREENEQGKKLWLGSLDLEWTADHLKEYFGQYGIVDTCYIAKEKGSEKSRKFGFLFFHDIESVTKVLEIEKHFIEEIEFEVSALKPRKIHEPKKKKISSQTKKNRRNEAKNKAEAIETDKNEVEVLENQKKLINFPKPTKNNSAQLQVPKGTSKISTRDSTRHCTGNTIPDSIPRDQISLDPKNCQQQNNFQDYDSDYTEVYSNYYNIPSSQNQLPLNTNQNHYPLPSSQSKYETNYDCSYQNSNYEPISQQNYGPISQQYYEPVPQKYYEPVPHQNYEPIPQQNYYPAEATARSDQQQNPINHPKQYYSEYCNTQAYQPEEKNEDQTYSNNNYYVYEQNYPAKAPQSQQFQNYSHSTINNNNFPEQRYNGLGRDQNYGYQHETSPQGYHYNQNYYYPTKDNDIRQTKFN